MCFPSYAQISMISDNCGSYMDFLMIAMVAPLRTIFRQFFNRSHSVFICLHRAGDA